MDIILSLNDMKYRYDVYQMVNIFYPFHDIKFQDDDFHIKVNIGESEIEVRDSEKSLIRKNSQNIKEEIKKAVFSFFAEKSGKVMPWGTLVGIRPSKIALSLIKEGKSENEIIEFFKNHHYASEEKAKLCIDVAKYEEEFVNKDEKNISIYLGMPFCPTRCLYCSFTSNPIGGNKKIVEPYLESLSKEIIEIGKYVEEKGLKIQCVYFGGGTPTAIDDNQFEKLLNLVYNTFVNGKNIEEFTVECGRPDSLSIEKLKTMKRYNVSRISINPQTMNDDTLKVIGRNHSRDMVLEYFKIARDMGFDNINMDMIVGLPGEDLSHINKSYEDIVTLNPDSLTIHGMSIKRASRLYEELCLKRNLLIPEQHELNHMYGRTKELSEALDMKPYYMYRQKNMVGNMENVGYAKKGKEGIYNIQIIEERQTIIALGADAVTKVVFLDENRIERFANVKDVREYNSRIEEMIVRKKELLDSLYN